MGVAIVVAAAAGAVAFVKLRPDPARELFAGSLPAWQSARSRGGEAGGDAALARCWRPRSSGPTSPPR